ncbi:hypothetical protein [Cognatiyoonia sp.]|uniref:hypothetical protein n=1 Tax=Cognatiyoonia sp. TaxID=2211652 RepID=UPI003F69ABDD
MNTSPSAAQIGHVFMATCSPKLTPLMEKEFLLFDTAFGWDAAEAGTDFAFSPTDSDILATFDGNWEGGTCTLTISPAIGGDGADLYDGLITHVEAEFDPLPEADYTDGGVIWDWVQDGTVTITLTIEFTENDEGHTLRTQAKQF